MPEPLPQPQPEPRIICLPRGSGKTSMLVDMVRNTRHGLMLCANTHIATRVREHFGLRGDQVITPSDLYHLRGRDVTLFVDDAELVLHWFLNNHSIGAIAFTAQRPPEPMSQEQMERMRQQLQSYAQIFVEPPTPTPRASRRRRDPSSEYVISPDPVIRFDNPPGPGDTIHVGFDPADEVRARIDGVFSIDPMGITRPASSRSRPRPATGDLTNDDPTENS